MGRFNNNRSLAEAEFWTFTHKQLDEWGVKFHGLFLGKPAGDVYIDDKGTRFENWSDTINFVNNLEKGA